MIIRTQRLVAKTSRGSLIRMKSTVGPVIENKEQIDKFLSKSAWNLNEMINVAQSEMNQLNIDSKTIYKMIGLSGFSKNITPEREQVLINALKAQVLFMKALYDGDIREFDKKDVSNDISFRLIPSDHIKADPVTLESLMADIRNLENEVDPAKGETDSSVDIRKLNNGDSNYFIIKSNKE